MIGGSFVGCCTCVGVLFRIECCCFLLTLSSCLQQLYYYVLANTTRDFANGNTEGRREKKWGEEGERGGEERAERVKRWRGKERGGRGSEEWWGKGRQCEVRGREARRVVER